MMIKLERIIVNTLLIGYSLLNTSYFNITESDAIKNKKNAEYYAALQIFNHAQQIKDFKEALRNANSYINKIKYKLDKDNYGFENYYAPFPVINKKRTDDCDGQSIAGMALLYKFNPKMLIVSNDPFLEEAHAECLINFKDKFYLPRINPNYGLSSLEETINLISNRMNWNYRHYWVCEFALQDLLDSDDDIKDRIIITKYGKIE